jgi:hypothetical protein
MAQRKRAALDAALAAMFRTLQARPVPRHVRATLDELERSDAEPPAERQRKRA